MILRLKRTPGIYLAGFMGCGKSTVGRMLADHIGWRFLDLDAEIESDQHATIASIFARSGEEEFRRIETGMLERCVRNVQTGHPMVIALGGGTFTRQENVDLLSCNGVSIWIDAALPIVQKRVEAAAHRPLAKDRARFEELYHARRALYAKADFRVPVEQDDSRIVLADILSLPLFE